MTKTTVQLELRGKGSGWAKLCDAIADLETRGHMVALTLKYDAVPERPGNLLVKLDLKEMEPEAWLKPCDALSRMHADGTLAAMTIRHNMVPKRRGSLMRLTKPTMEALMGAMEVEYLQDNGVRIVLEQVAAAVLAEAETVEEQPVEAEVEASAGHGRVPDGGDELDELMVLMHGSGPIPPRDGEVYDGLDKAFEEAFKHEGKPDGEAAAAVPEPRPVALDSGEPVSAMEMMEAELDPMMALAMKGLAPGKPNGKAGNDFAGSL